MKKVLFVTAILALLLSSFVSAATFRVDSEGNITCDGEYFRIKGGSWFGLEGRHEPSDDPTNPSGAPMEMYMGNVFWAESGRTYEGDIQEFVNMGINVVRLPVAPQTLDASDPQGMAPYLKNAPSVVIANARLAMETVIQLLDDAGIYVMLDVHSCSNYVGWRAGRFDARPPYVDADRDQYDFPREDCSCSASNNPSSVTNIQAYNASAWLSDLTELAGLGSSLGVDNIIGIDIFNEPWDYTWAEWSGYIDDAYEAINAVDSDMLIFAQGISASAGNQDGTPDSITQVPHGVEETNPNWGENLYEAGANPPSMPKDRLVFTPHTYGPSVFVQKMFMDPSQPECEGLEGDAAGDAECNIIINSTILEEGWDEHFGYLKALGYAVCIGEFGGNPDWPNKATLRDQDRYSYLTDTTVDWQWQQAFVAYLVDRGITDTVYWSINPESGDTGGIYGHAYDPVSNTAGWGTWLQPEQRKLDLLSLLWDAPTPDLGNTPTPTPDGETPTPTPDAGEGGMIFNADSYSVGTGADLSVTVLADVDGATVAAYGASIAYDSSVLTYVSAVDAGYGGTLVVNDNGSEVVISAFSVAGSSVADLATITFTAADSAADTTLTLTVDTLVDGSYVDLGTAGDTASVTIGGVKGDANGDGAITIVDALMIAQLYVGTITSIPGDGDVNCDGAITIVDALIVAQYYVGSISALPC